MVGLSEIALTAYEDDGSVQICTELLKGRLGTNIDLIVEAEVESDSGIDTFSRYNS